MIPKMMKASFFILASLMFCVNAQSATLAGKAAFEGTAPASEPLKLDADPNCKLAHPQGMTSDDVIVNANGTLKNVFVYVKEGLPAGKTYDVPKDPALLDQKGCQYAPKVQGIRVNQPLVILNSDPTLHNVHALPKDNKEFNLGMPVKGMKLTKTFTKPEVMIKFKCEVHPWMNAYIGVLDHPYFAVTGDDGGYEIKDLPPGRYVIEAWHQKYGSKTQTLTVSADGDTVQSDFHLQA